MVMGKKVAIFDWEWGGNSAPGDGQKIPLILNWIESFCAYRSISYSSYLIPAV